MPVHVLLLLFDLQFKKYHVIYHMFRADQEATYYTLFTWYTLHVL